MGIITRDIKRQEFKPVYLLYGEEEFLRNQRAKELADAVVEKDLMDFNYTVFNGLESDISNIGVAIMAPPVFSLRRVVLIWDANELSEDERKIIAAVLSKMPSTTVLILVASNIDARTKLFKTISKQGRAILFRRFYPNQALNWLLTYVRSKGIIIDRIAGEYLVTVIGSDLSQLVAGVERAYDYAGIALGKEKKITLEHVKAVVSGTPEFGVFHLVDAIGERNIESALISLKQLMIFQEVPLKILGLIARQMRLILKTKILKNENLPNRQIARILGVQEFVAGKCIIQADKFQLEELERAFSKMLETDVELKSSGCPDQVVLERLIFYLCTGSHC